MSAEPGELIQELTHQRAENGLLAKFLQLTLPPHPEALHVWPAFAHQAALCPDGGRKRNILRFLPLVLVLLVCTLGMIVTLLEVPGLNYSVVGLLSMAFGLFLPQGWATGAAWVVGLAAVISLGSFTKLTSLQRKLDEESASKNSFYNFWLLMALREEMLFRAGAEKWSLRHQLQASIVFGAIHITNIWYSFAAGIALSLTGFGFMLVYLWAYRRYRNPLVATAYAAIVHALYNMVAVTMLVTALLVMLVSLFF